MPWAIKLWELLLFVFLSFVASMEYFEGADVKDSEIDRT